MRFIVLLLLSMPVWGLQQQPLRWCLDAGGVTEIVTDHPRCVTASYTAVVSDAENWRVALVQTLQDAAELQLRAKLVLVMYEPIDVGMLAQAEQTVRYYQLPVDLEEM